MTNLEFCSIGLDELHIVMLIENSCIVCMLTVFKVNLLELIEEVTRIAQETLEDISATMIIYETE